MVHWGSGVGGLGGRVGTGVGYGVRLLVSSSEAELRAVSGLGSASWFRVRGPSGDRRRSGVCLMVPSPGAELGLVLVLGLKFAAWF